MCTESERARERDRERERERERERFKKENYIYNKLKKALFENQTKKCRVLTKIRKAYICTPKCDAFGNSFFPLLSKTEC